TRLRVAMPAWLARQAASLRGSAGTARVLNAFEEPASERPLLSIRCRRAGTCRASSPAQYDPPQDGAPAEQREWPQPQQPCRALERRIIEDEVAVARDEIAADFVVGLARDRELAHFPAQIRGQIGVGIGERLVLAH